MSGIIFRISMRNLLKNRFTSLVSLLGLMVGFVAVVLVALFIKYELSWDKHNENYDRIFIVQRDIALSARNSGTGSITPFTPPVTAPLLEEYPGFERVASVYQVGDRFLSVSAERQYRIDRGIYADRNFFDVFTCSFADGRLPDEFGQPFTVVISESLAGRLFEGEAAEGMVVTLDGKHELMVAGVYNDLPLNSTIRPEYIISLPTLLRTEGIGRDDIIPASFMTFVMLGEGAGREAAEAAVRDLFAGRDGMEMETLRLGALAGMRLDSVPDYYNIIWIFGLIGVFILSMSVFNYVNLTIAGSSIRGKEIAIKKMSGCKRPGLILQFLGESVVVSVIGFAISIYLASLLLPFFNSIMGTAIDPNFFHDWRVTAILAAGAAGIGLLAGAYPAFLMSSNSIVNLFKGEFKAGSDRIKLRKVLVLLQFSISVFLICLSLFFLVQVNHLTSKDIGFDRENMIYVQLTTPAEEICFEDFRSRLLQSPAILNASMSDNLPFVNFGGGMINWEGADPGTRVRYRPNSVSWDFVGNLGISLVDGRDFSRDYPSDVHNACLVNETAVRYFGWDNPIGKRLDNNRYTVVGVVADYHVMDIHNPLDPVVLTLAPGEMTGSRVYAFRYLPGYRDEAVGLLASEFSRVFPDDPFVIEELESAFMNENAYRSYQTVKKSVLLFTGFSLFLAVTGLLGLVSFSVLRRTKEIGIRKINGCPDGVIFLLLNREFFILLGISLALAWPGAWLVHNAFPGAYKLPLYPWILISSAAAIVTVTLAATGWQTWRAAIRNPVEALRYE
ncbi:MAG: FtsX-like permease family protein [Marinilabiliales bacterium]|nr:MAG: FtsX-like permease family protein [Marinilabiliales bacterium]